MKTLIPVLLFVTGCTQVKEIVNPEKDEVAELADALTDSLNDGEGWTAVEGQYGDVVNPSFQFRGETYRAYVGRQPPNTLLVRMTLKDKSVQVEAQFKDGERDKVWEAMFARWDKLNPRKLDLPRRGK